MRSLLKTTVSVYCLRNHRDQCQFSVDDILIMNAVVTRSMARQSCQGEITRTDRPLNTSPEAKDSSQAHGDSSPTRSWSQSFSRTAFDIRQI